jgi:hypothetical protein
MSNKRANLSDLGRQYEHVRHEVMAEYPKAKQSRTRLAVLAHLHVLADKMAEDLEILEGLNDQSQPQDTPPWLKADKPIAALRDYRVELLQKFQTSGGIPDGDPEIARLREVLSREPAPGFELIDASKLLFWYLQMYLFIQTQAEAATTTGLLGEDHEDYIDESARSSIPQAQHNQTLARLALDSAEGEYDAKVLGRTRKSIERRRDFIDKFLGAYATDFQKMAREYYEGLLHALPQDSKETEEINQILAHIDDPMNPTTRRLMKQWLTVHMVREAQLVRKPRAKRPSRPKKRRSPSKRP